MSSRKYTFFDLVSAALGGANIGVSLIPPYDLGSITCLAIGLLLLFTIGMYE
jgi:hypothetical protein